MNNEREILYALKATINIMRSAYYIFLQIMSFNVEIHAVWCMANLLNITQSEIVLFAPILCGCWHCEFLGTQVV